MAYKTLHDLLKRREGERKTVAVAGCHDKDVLEALYACRTGFSALLFGEQHKTAQLMEELGYDPSTFTIVDCSDTKQAAEGAAKAVAEGKASVLMKGMCETPVFLKAILNSPLKPMGMLSHLGAFEAPAYGRLIFCTDGGMNAAPDLEQKKMILQNALDALHKLGYECPNVALICASETVNPKIQATVDAEALASAGLPGCTLEGPVALDVALSADAAKHKGIKSRIAGETDLLLVPNIESGNIFGKAVIYIGMGKMAGVILGARCPIVLTSRAENMEGKVNSLLLACML